MERQEFQVQKVNFIQNSSSVFMEISAFGIGLKNIKTKSQIILKTKGFKDILTIF